jgi:hypothetical protein
MDSKSYNQDNARLTMVMIKHIYFAAGHPELLRFGWLA